MAKHQYLGVNNDRSKRQRSKIVKGIKRIASPKTFDMLRWEKACPDLRPMFNFKSDFICDNCKNFKCFRK